MSRCRAGQTSRTPAAAVLPREACMPLRYLPPLSATVLAAGPVECAGAHQNLDLARTASWAHSFMR